MGAQEYSLLILLVSGILEWGWLQGGCRLTQRSVKKDTSLTPSGSLSSCRHIPPWVLACEEKPGQGVGAWNN